jgi:hypothetical protein
MVRLVQAVLRVPKALLVQLARMVLQVRMVRTDPMGLDCHLDLVIRGLLEVLVALHCQPVLVILEHLEDQMIPQDQENLRLPRHLLGQLNLQNLVVQWDPRVQGVLETLEIRLVQRILADPVAQMVLLARQDPGTLEDLGVPKNQCLH